MEYITCVCNHCSGHIEFPVEGGGREVECPHCGMTTILYRPATPSPVHEPRNKQPGQSPGAKARPANVGRIPISLKLPPKQPSVKKPSRAIILGGAALIVLFLGVGVAIQKQRAAKLAVIEAAKPREISGQIYLALQGGGSVKLAAVEVLVIGKDDAKTITSLISSQFPTVKSNLMYLFAERARLSQQAEFALREARAAPEMYRGLGLSRFNQDLLTAELQLKLITPVKERLDHVAVEIGRWNTPQIFFRAGLPNSLYRTVTDADGRFILRVPKQGAFYLMALTERSEGNSVAHYGWLVPLSPDANNQMFLHNNNRLPLPLDLNTPP